jgi:cytochrome c
VRRAALAIALIAAVPATGQDVPRFRQVMGGDPDLGRGLIADYACGVCHTIPGIRGARGSVGPDLTRFGSRDLIAGVAPNRPDVLVLWIQEPQIIAPDTGMPDVGVTAEEARHIAAYLASLRGEDEPFWAGPVDLARTLLRGPE